MRNKIGIGTRLRKLRSCLLGLIWCKKNLNPKTIGLGNKTLGPTPMYQTRSKTQLLKNGVIALFVASLDTMQFNVAIGRELRSPIQRQIWQRQRWSQQQYPLRWAWSPIWRTRWWTLGLPGISMGIEVHLLPITL